MRDPIERQDAIDYCYALINAENPSDPSDEWNYSQERINQTEVILHHLEFMPSAQPESQWIPCSDENPKADGRYLITGKMGTVYSIDFKDGRWYGGIKPVAWMLLPKPYAERREP